MRPKPQSTTALAGLTAVALLWAALPATAEPSRERAAQGLTETEPAPPTASEQGTPGGQGDPSAAPAGERAGKPREVEGTQEIDKRREGRTQTASKRRKLGERTLRSGTKGSDVRHLQKILTAMNFKTRVDGRYGAGTKRSVRRYERWGEPQVNGVVHMQQAKRLKARYRRGARYRRHVFPVRGPHDYGGEGSRFGAPRSGHRHQGQDVAAAEGTRLVAVHEGRVATRAYQAGGAGNYVVIHGKDGSDSVYMHLQKPARVKPGERVMAGQRIGRVGTTGSSTGPHLHFELWTRHWYAGGSPYDPLSKLRLWDRRT